MSDSKATEVNELQRLSEKVDKLAHLVELLAREDEQSEEESCESAQESASDEDAAVQGEQAGAPLFGYRVPIASFIKAMHQRRDLTGEQTIPVRLEDFHASFAELMKFNGETTEARWTQVCEEAEVVQAVDGVTAPVVPRLNSKAFAAIYSGPVKQCLSIIQMLLEALSVSQINMGYVAAKGGEDWTLLRSSIYMQKATADRAITKRNAILCRMAGLVAGIPEEETLEIRGEERGAAEAGLLKEKKKRDLRWKKKKKYVSGYGARKSPAKKEEEEKTKTKAAQRGSKGGKKKNSKSGQASAEASAGADQ